MQVNVILNEVKDLYIINAISKHCGIPRTSRLQMSKEYYVYIMTNASRTLYVGVTNNLMRRVYEHKHKLIEGFTSKYNIHILVYYESTLNVHAALAREKEIKGWLRSKKIALIESMNPEWKDLSEDWWA